MRAEAIGSPRLAARGAGLSLEESLDELAALASAARARVSARMLQQRSRYDPAYLIGKGKVERLKGLLDRHRADTVIFDDNLSPAQQRNIERALDCKVVDRTQLIPGHLRQPARGPGRGSCRSSWPSSTTGCLDWGGRGVELSRLGGGIGTRGPGETKLETDQRKIHQRIHKIKRDSPAGEGAPAVATAPFANPFPFPPSRWSDTPMPANPPSSMP